MDLTLCKVLRVRTYQILSPSQLTHRALIIVNPAHLSFTPALIVLNPTSQGPFLINPAHLGFTPAHAQPHLTGPLF